MLLKKQQVSNILLNLNYKPVVQQKRSFNGGFKITYFCDLMCFTLQNEAEMILFDNFLYIDKGYVD